MSIKFIEKLYKNISFEEKGSLKECPFICYSPHESGLPYFQYLVVDLSNKTDDQLIAKFNKLVRAEEYISFLLKRIQFHKTH